MESSVLSNFSAIDKKIELSNNAISLNQDNILSVYHNYSSSLSAINSTVQYQLETISKMPGPQVQLHYLPLYYTILIKSVKCQDHRYNYIISLYTILH